MKQRILIADDHDLVRDMVVTFLEGSGEFEVVPAASFTEARETIEEGDPFDLVLLDYAMPGMDGLAGLRAALALQNGRPVAIMSGVADQSIARDALEIGAAGFLPKTLRAKALVNAVNFMLAGEQYAPIAFMTAPEPTHPMAEKLTERELQVLEGLCAGKSNKEIALDLDLQEVTIKLHVRTLCRKIEAKNRTHAAMIAKEAGLF